MDQYLPWSDSLSVGESTDSPCLPGPLTRQIIAELISGSVVGSLTGEPTVAVAQPSMPDLSREGPFDVHQGCSTSGASPRVLDSMRGCQYRMTSYDEDREWRSGFQSRIRNTSTCSAAAGICGCAGVGLTAQQ